MNHDATESATAATNMLASGLSRDRDATGLFATALAASQTASGTQKTAITHPAGLARHERSIRPRASHANAVVMPQVGHNRPVIVRYAHSLSPI